MELFVVATPIGNLADISTRALEVLGQAEVILAEDTRVTGKLLAHFGIAVPLWRCDQYTDGATLEKLLAKLEGKERVVLTTDAGTPNLSDPAFIVVAGMRQRFENLKITPIPGPSALAAAISIAHFPVQPFIFFGFPPHKKGREKFFDEVATAAMAVVLYESVYRVADCMEALAKRVPDRECLVSRELTKIFEETRRGKVSEVAAQVAAGTLKGEYVIILAPQKWRNI